MNKRDGGIVDADVKCPFYHRHKRYSVLCEGLYKGTMLTVQFETSDDRVIQMERFCRDRYQDCRICRAISSMVYGER